MKILIVGGSKSGKSMAAQRIARMLAARGSCPAYYWATMEPSDSEDEKRIARHLEARAGWGFETIECGRNTSAFSASVRGGCVLFDSVTALLANEMFPPPAQNADFPLILQPGNVLRPNCRKLQAQQCILYVYAMTFFVTECNMTLLPKATAEHWLLFADSLLPNSILWLKHRRESREL